MLDAEERVVLVNRAFERTFQRSGREVLGKKLEDLLPADIAGQHRAVGREVLRTRRPYHIEETVPIAGRPRHLSFIEFPVGDDGVAWPAVACAGIDTSGQSREASLHALQDVLQRHAAFLLDTDGRVVSWNQASESLLGYSADEVLNQNVSVMFAAHDNRAGLLSHLLAGAAGNMAEINASLVSRSGVPMPAELVFAGRSGAGVHGGYIVFARALVSSAPSRSDAVALPESSGNYGGQLAIGQHTPIEEVELNRTVLNSVPAHIAVLDDTGRIIHVNDAWNRFAADNGARHGAKVGVGASYIGECRRASHQGDDQASEALQGITAVLHREIPEFCLEYPCHSPDKQRWFLLVAAPLGGNRKGAVVSHTDITQRVIAEEELKRTSAFYRALIDNASDVVTIIDQDGGIHYESPSIEKVLGYEPKELIGQNCFTFIHSADVSRVRQIVCALQDDGATTAPVEFSFRHKNGSWRILEGVARAAFQNPAVRGILVASRDITERREAESQLREKERALSQSNRTLQSVAGRLIDAEDTERKRVSRELHDDLNQKLAILAVDAGGLARTLPGSDAKRIEREMKALQSRLTHICGQVRTLAYQLHPSILDDLGLVVALRSYCAEFSLREGIEVRFTHRKVSRNIPQEQASTIYRISQEALRNVAKHSGARTASVSLTGSERDIVLRIRDTGRGFPVSAAKVRGGLGLTSMEERARMLGGSLEVRSIPGRGTIIQARIPWKSASL